MCILLKGPHPKKHPVTRPTEGRRCHKIVFQFADKQFKIPFFCAVFIAGRVGDVYVAAGANLGDDDKVAVLSQGAPAHKGHQYMAVFEKFSHIVRRPLGDAFHLKAKGR